MAVLRVGPRLHVAKQVQFNQPRAKGPQIHGFVGRELAIEIVNAYGKTMRASDAFINGRLSLKSPVMILDAVRIDVRSVAGHSVKIEQLEGMTPEEIDITLANVDWLMEAVASRQPQNIFPPTLDVVGQTYKRIMIGELTGIEAAQFLKPAEVGGHNAAELKPLLEKPSDEALIYTNVNDAKRYIERANGQGRKLRFMTNQEFDALPDDVMAQLKGNNWFLVETSRGSGEYCWRSLRYAHRGDGHPGNRFDVSAVHLVED